MSYPGYSSIFELKKQIPGKTQNYNGCCMYVGLSENWITKVSCLGKRKKGKTTVLLKELVATQAAWLKKINTIHTV